MPAVGRASTGRQLGWAHALAVAAALVVSRVAAHAAGVRFDARPIEIWYQFLDVDLLRTDLLRSLVYLHSQPPLLNLVCGLVLKICPGHEVAAFRLLFAMTGWALAAALLCLMVRLGVRPTVAVVLTVLCVVSPSAILYENLLFYTYPLAALLCLAALFLHRSIQHGCSGDAHAMQWCAAALPALRSLFHLGWLALVVALSALVPALAPAPARRRLLCAAIAPFLLVTLIYAKNLVLFGSFASSTWLGMSLARMTTFAIPDDERARLIDAGTLSPVSRVKPFSDLPEYPSVPRPPPMGVPAVDAPVKEGVLDDPAMSRWRAAPAGREHERNLNHAAYVEISHRYLTDALAVLARYPRTYVARMARSWGIYFRPASDYKGVEENARCLGGLETVYDRLVYGELLPRETEQDQDQGTTQGQETSASSPAATLGTARALAASAPGESGTAEQTTRRALPAGESHDGGGGLGNSGNSSGGRTSGTGRSIGSAGGGTGGAGSGSRGASAGSGGAGRLARWARKVLGWQLVLVFGTPLLWLHGASRLRRALASMHSEPVAAVPAIAVPEPSASPGLPAPAQTAEEVGAPEKVQDGDRSASSADAATLAFILFNVLYVPCAGNALEFGENNRFRFMTEPFFFVLLGLWLTALLDRRAGVANGRARM